MSSPKRPSPRAAIREWLSHTSAANPTGIKQNTDVLSTRHEGHSKNSYPVGHPKGPQPEATGAELRSNKDPHEDRRSRGDQPAASRGGHNVAERLGLHAPFRSFASRSADPHTESQSENQRRKRRRKSSSSASFLEPAVYPNPSHGSDQEQKSLGPKKSKHHRQTTHVDLPLRASNAVVDSAEKSAKNYERRSRHKTREDRYDFQKDREPDQKKEVKTKTGIKSKKKRKGVQKSGAALMQNFSAGNVETDRLTLKASVPVGFFGKGRASSPIKRKGLPDLTFSEINFLNHRRGNPEDTVRARARGNRRKEAKADDAEAAFSRFFATPKDTSRAAIGTIGHGSSVKGRSSVGVTEDQDQSSLPPVELPEKPFLGFGSCGPGHISPVMLSRATVPNDFGRLSPTRRSLSTRSTTYFTWSRSSPCKRTVSDSPSYRTINAAEPRQCHIMEGKHRERRLSGTNARRSSEVSRTPPIRHDGPSKDIEEHRQIGCDTPVPKSIHDRAKQISAGLDRTKVNSQGLPEQQGKVHNSLARDNPQPQHPPSTGTDLASLLASQNRPELLGAVLDLLLGKTSTETAGSRGENYLAVPEVVRKSPMQCEVNVVHSGEPPHSDYNLALSPERPASARQIPDMQRPQSSGTNKSKSAIPPTGCHSQNLEATSETNKPPEPLKPSGPLLPSPPDQLSDRPSRVIGSRPNTSTAWTGYRNIYQGQLDMQTRTLSQGENYKDVHPNKCKGRTEAESPATRTLDKELQSRWFNRHHPRMFEEDPPPESHLRHSYPFTHQVDTPAFTRPEPFEAIDEIYPQQQRETYVPDQEPRDGFLPERGDQIPWEQPDDGVPGLYSNEDAGVFPACKPFAFLGAKEPWILGQQEGFPSWGPCQTMGTQDRTFEALNHEDKGVAAMEDKVPLAGFWKPHRLY